jgi:hypothetical protein
MTIDSNVRSNNVRLEQLEKNINFSNLSSLDDENLQIAIIASYQTEKVTIESSSKEETKNRTMLVELQKEISRHITELL